MDAQLQSLRNDYATYLQTQSQLQVQDGTNDILLVVQVPASPDGSPVRLKAVENLGVGLVCGLLLGLLVVIGRAQLDLRVRDANEAAELLGWPVLVNTSEVGEGSGDKRGRDAEPRGTATAPESAYHALVHRLEFLSIESRLRSLAFVGSQGPDRSGDVAMNVALAMAQRGRRTLLIDADVSQPAVSERFGLSDAGGLSDAVLALHQGEPGDAMLQRYLHQGAQHGMPMLSVMSAGTKPPNPEQVLESPAMGGLFKTLLTTGADMAIYSVPSVLGRVSAKSLESGVDGVVVVVDMKRARRPRLLRTKARLDAAHAHVLGIVVADGAKERQGGEAGAAKAHQPDGRGAPKAAVEASAATRRGAN